MRVTVDRASHPSDGRHGPGAERSRRRPSRSSPNERHVAGGRRSLGADQATRSPNTALSHASAFSTTCQIRSPESTCTISSPPIRARSSSMLRPSLLIAAARAFGADTEQALNTAAAVELMHNAMLVHDDIEDISNVRRGAPSLHRMAGVPLAVNAGDALALLCLQPLLDNASRPGPGVGPADSRRSRWRRCFKRLKGRRGSWGGAETMPSISTPRITCGWPPRRPAGTPPSFRVARPH